MSILLTPLHRLHCPNDKLRAISSSKSYAPFQNWSFHHSRRNHYRRQRSKFFYKKKEKFSMVFRSLFHCSFCFLCQFYSPIDSVFIIWVYNSSLPFPRRRRRHFVDSIFIVPWFFHREVRSFELFIQIFFLGVRIIKSTRGFCGHHFA